MNKPRILPIINQKGGVSKTSSSKNIAAGLSLLGHRVLLIDFDPQGNASSELFKQEIPLDRTVYNLITPNIREPLDYKDFIITYEQGSVKFDVLPSDINLAMAELELMTRTGREFYFKNRILSKIEGYDFIIIDCPPSLGNLVLNVLCASNDSEIIIPVRPDPGSRKGIRFLFETISSLKESLGVMPKSYKILITQVLDEQVSDKFNQLELEKEHFGNIFKTKIRKDTKIAGASDDNFKLDIFTFDPKSRGAEDYMKVAKEIVENNE